MQTKLKKTKIITSFAVGLIILVALILFSMRTGSLELTLSKIVKGLFVSYDQDVATVYDLRFPRILISVLAGAALATSGVLLQAVMKNPLTDPGIIGISSAASLTATILVMIYPKLYFSIPALSIAGGLLAYLLIYSLAWEGGSNPVRLILVGVALNMTFIGIGEVLRSMSGGNLTKVQSIIEGNVAQKTWADVRLLTIYTIIGLVLALFTIRTCNLLSLEDKTAKSLGVNVNRDRFLVAFIAIILASSTTAVVGVVGFLGLIVPHIIRIFLGNNHKSLLPFSMLLGSILMLLSDTLGRVIAYPYEVPSAVIMTVVGGPFFILLLKIGGKHYGN